MDGETTYYIQREEKAIDRKGKDMSGDQPSTASDSQQHLQPRIATTDGGETIRPFGIARFGDEGAPARRVGVQE